MKLSLVQVSLTLAGIVFLTLGKGLKKEYLHFGIVNNDEEWEKKQLAFLQKHHYSTKSSNALREPQKQKNLRMLIA